MNDKITFDSAMSLILNSAAYKALEAERDALTAKLAECEKRVEGLRNALESAKYQLECDRGKIVDASYTQGITEILGVVRKALLTKEAPAAGKESV